VKKRIGVLIGLSVLAAGCQWGADSSRGFSLPEGDAQAGSQAFVKYGCVNCHAVEGIMPKPDHKYALPQPIALGGKGTRVQTYGELVTSIINPSHKLAPRLPVSMTMDGKGSKMANLNEELTVADLVDLVTFLQPKFNVKPDRLSEYRRYELRQKDKTN
jgi:mono/diheme cytochrome c family protein